MPKCRFFSSLLSLLGHFFPLQRRRKTNAPKASANFHNLCFQIPVRDSMNIQKIWWLLLILCLEDKNFNQPQDCTCLREYSSICRTSHLSFHSLLFTYLLQYPVSWWDWERGLDLMFKSQAGLLWSDREKCWWRRQIQLTGQRAPPSTCLYGSGGLLLLLWVMFGNNRVIEPGCVDTGANWATRANGKPGIHRDLWSAVGAGSIPQHGQISPTGLKPLDKSGQLSLSFIPTDASAPPSDEITWTASAAALSRGFGDLRGAVWLIRRALMSPCRFINKHSSRRLQKPV